MGNPQNLKLIMTGGQDGYQAQGAPLLNCAFNTSSAVSNQSSSSLVGDHNNPDTSLEANHLDHLVGLT